MLEIISQSTHFNNFQNIHLLGNFENENLNKELMKQKQQ